MSHFCTLMTQLCAIKLPHWFLNQLPPIRRHHNSYYMLPMTVILHWFKSYWFFCKEPINNWVSDGIRLQRQAITLIGDVMKRDRLNVFILLMLNLILIIRQTVLVFYDEGFQLPLKFLCSETIGNANDIFKPSQYRFSTRRVNIIPQTYVRHRPGDSGHSHQTDICGSPT